MFFSRPPYAWVDGCRPSSVCCNAEHYQTVVAVIGIVAADKVRNGILFQSHLTTSATCFPTEKQHLCTHTKPEALFDCAKNCLVVHVFPCVCVYSAFVRMLEL